jgi:5-methylcytosine-specific restriction endonuclease McrA
MSDPFYGTQAWRQLRAACLRRDRICRTEGCNELAVVADHIKPRAEGGTDTLDNLAGRCIRCHNARRGTGEPPIIGCSLDGTPRDPRHWWRT